MALSFSTLSASVLWLFGQSQILLVEFNASTVGIGLYVNGEGWICTLGPAVASKPVFDVRTHSYEFGSTSWEELLGDVSPKWYTSGLVVAVWKPNAAAVRMIYLCGFRHYLVVPALGFATLVFSLWFRRRWPTNEDSE